MINIYDDGENGVWVADFADDALVKLPEEVEKLINTILEFIGANETKTKGSFTIGGEKVDKDDDDDDKDENDKKEDDTDKTDKDDNDEDDKKEDDSDESNTDKKSEKDKKKSDIDVDDLL